MHVFVPNAVQCEKPIAGLRNATAPHGIIDCEAGCADARMLESSGNDGQTVGLHGERWEEQSVRSLIVCE